jgi:ubiquinone/menaquinone biosynthesis C-methylase UbiE
MSNNDLLTGAEFLSYRPHPTMIDHIERCRSTFGIAEGDFRIMDWGCGRGKLVLWLRESGYNAVGVDIDIRPFANGAHLFQSKGYQVEQCLHGLGTGFRAPFADSSFHFVTSWQTLEHVKDLEAVAAEWARLTVDNGAGFHIYPPHRRVVEGHLFMPLVHWLPKNALRQWLIGSFVLLGIEPNWWLGKRVSWEDKVRTYYEYSINETFYRPPEVVRSCMAAYGFQTEFVDVQTDGSGRKLAQKWLGSSSSWRLVRAWFMNYGQNLGLATSLHSAPISAPPQPAVSSTTIKCQ